MKKTLAYVLALSMIFSIIFAPAVNAAENDIIDEFVNQMSKMEDKKELVELIKLLAFVDGKTTVKDAYTAAFKQFSSSDQVRWNDFKKTMDVISVFAVEVVKDTESLVLINNYLGINGGTAQSDSLETLIRTNETTFKAQLKSVTNANLISGFKQLAIVFRVLEDSKTMNMLGFSVPMFLTNDQYMIQALNVQNSEILVDIANGILGSPTNDKSSIINGLKSFIESYNDLTTEDINIVYGYLNQRGFTGIYTGEESEEDGELITIKDERIAQGFGFIDVLSNSAAKMAIERLYQAGVINGKSATSFDPQATVTRAEFSAMVTRLLEITADGNTVTFEDIHSNAWYADEVMAAYHYGVIEGVGNGKFSPNAVITKQEMITMVARILVKRGYAYQSEETKDAIISYYEDKSEIHSWAEYAVALTVSLGIVDSANLDNAYKLNPNDLTSREEAAMMLFNLAKQIASNVDTVDHALNTK